MFLMVLVIMRVNLILFKGPTLYLSLFSFLPRLMLCRVVVEHVRKGTKNKATTGQCGRVITPLCDITKI